MNLNKISIAVCCILIILVIVSGFNQANNNKFRYNLIGDNELLKMNIQCIPKVVQSYERVKQHYEKNILLFRYAQTTCSTCNDANLNEILELQEEIGKDNILIFPAYLNDRASKIRLSNELAKFNYL